MSIGLWDDDAARYFPTAFNLELMKIAAYYKKKREIVQLSPHIRPEMYTKFFFRKDYDDNYFHRVLTEPNVFYGGYAFHPGKYVPMEYDIEVTPPDTTIYAKFQTEPRYESVRNLQFNTKHLRLSLDGTNLWQDWERASYRATPYRTVLIHDYDAQKIFGVAAVVRQILRDSPRKDTLLGMKFPPQCYNADQFLDWCDFPCGRFFQLQYNGEMSDFFVRELIKRFNDPQHGLSKQVYRILLNPTYGWSNENDFFENGLPKLYEQLTILRRYIPFVILIYDKDFFSNPIMEFAFFLFQRFFFGINGITHKAMSFEGRNITFPKWVNNSLYEFVRFYIYTDHDKKNVDLRCYTKEDCRAAFQYIREKSYETFKQFYNPVKEVSNGD